MQDRFDRQTRLFGVEGQQELSEARIAIVGVGGLGTHVVQQLALLGIDQMALIDHEELSLSNRNRYVGARESDSIPGALKVELGARLVELIDSSINVVRVSHGLCTEPAFNAIRAAHYVFGCLDHDGPRFVLNELCLAYEKTLFDLASDVPEPGAYGGRIVTVTNRVGCLYCRSQLDMEDVRRYLADTEARENEDAVYGVDRDLLGDAGPSVVSINGTVASLAVTEFMCACTGLREPFPVLSYRGHEGRVSRIVDEPMSECHYCTNTRGQGRNADIERYIEGN